MEAPEQPWELVKFANNHLLLEAWKRGEIDGGISSAIFLPELAADKTKLKILGAASREGITVFASRKGKFKDLSNLKGATVSIPAQLTVHGALLYKVLARQGLKGGSEVAIKTFPPAQGFKALAEGAVDLVLVMEPLASRIAAEGKFAAVAHSRDLWPQHLSFISFISSAKISENPSLEAKWGESYHKSLKRLSTDYQGVAQEMASRLGCDPQNLLGVLQSPLTKILYDRVAISEEEKKEWSRLIAALKEPV